MIGVYSNMYYQTRWVPLKRRGLGWQRCNEMCKDCVASCGLAYDKILELVLDIKGCNLNCKYCWCWKMRYGRDIKKDSTEVLRDLECRFDRVSEDALVSRKGYKIGVIRITGNEPSLQWNHVFELLKLIDRSEKLKSCKVIVETNGIMFGIGKVGFTGLDDLEIEIDIDISFKGVNYDQFEWLSSVRRELFRYQIEGFVKLFDHYEGSNVNVNPVLGINHAKNYCVWRRGRKYVMDVEIVDEKGERIDFYDYSEDFENEVLSRKELRYDEAPFREYFGINKDTTRLVVAVLYKGKRYLHVLPSEIPDLI